MDLHLPCEDPLINDVVPIWNPTAVANAERIRLQGIFFYIFITKKQSKNNQIIMYSILS